MHHGRRSGCEPIMRAGIPRCLSYYYLYPLYRGFLSSLGVETIESPPTTSRDLERLSLCPTDEPCISVKSAFGHAAGLFERGADFLFVPTIVSLSRTGYCCPKMMGLPAMLRAGLDLEGWQVLSPVVDMKDDPRGWRKTWARAAWALGEKDAGKAVAALDWGLAAWRRFEKEQVVHLPGQRGATAVMGHAYVLGDIFAQKVTQVARTYGPVVLPEMVPEERAVEALRSVFDGEKMWTIEGRILGASMHLLRTRAVDRMIFVSAFSCGPASIIENYIASEAETCGIPLLNLAVDEHTGEAGLVTRLEAFLDSAGRKSRLVAKPGILGVPVAPVTGEAGRVFGPGVSSGSSRPGASAAVRTAGCGTRAPNPDAIGVITMGNLSIPLSALLQELGAEIAPPPPLSDGIVNLGKEIAPEFICYPMVTLIGQMRWHAENGVRRVIMVQGKGRCRLGWYAQVMEQILERSGHDMKVLMVDSPFPLRERWGAFTESVARLGGEFNGRRLAVAAALAFSKMAALDRAEEILRQVRAVEEARGEGDRRHSSFIREIADADSLGAISRVYRQYAREMREIPAVDCDPLKVEVVGEIYVVNEPFVNKQAEKALGSMERRVRVMRSLDVSGWVSYHLFKTPKAVRAYRTVTGLAEAYLPVAVGGHGQESIGETVLAKKRGVDGILHLFPFTCMPEIIAQNVLVKVSRDLDIPVLSLMISEQTGAAGFYTRLEAFCDLLAGRRKAALERAQLTS